MKIFYINNPAAGHKNGEKFFPLIIKEFENQKIEVDSVKTEYPNHATEIVNRLDFTKYDGLAVSGGDGSLFEIVNGYFSNPSIKRIPIGIIPVGRGNAFARDINLFLDRWQESISVIKSQNTKMVDVGMFSSNNKKFYFINILGFGFVTDVGKTAFKLRAFGDLSYILGVFHATISLKPFMLQLEIDGKQIERENVFVEISNSRYTGKDFLMAPNASIEDGLLDVTLLNKLTRIKLMQCLPKIFTGEHLKMREVETFKAREIKIVTTPKKLLTPDGQLMESTPIEIECIPKAIEVFVNN
jgi:YegS/Rv2252/BmrU family lipid kinase